MRYKHGVTCTPDFIVCGFSVSGLVGVSSIPGKRST